MFPLLVAGIITIFLILLLPTSQEIIHWFLLVGVCVQVSKSDVNDGISLNLPESPNENVTLYIGYTR